VGIGGVGFREQACSLGICYPMRLFKELEVTSSSGLHLDARSSEDSM
jgi:hypothetical protein